MCRYLSLKGNTETSNAVAIVVAPNYSQSILTIDFGWERVPFDTLLIGDYVWIGENFEESMRKLLVFFVVIHDIIIVLDSNNDGIQQDVSSNRYERPLEGVFVQLLRSDGTFIAETSTSSSGLYTFDR